MAVLDPSRRLRQELSLLGVFAIALGATLSSGFFLLPGLAAAEAGPAVVVTYLIALLPLIPGILSKVELSTAMPRAGGVYYFIDRAIGPLFGTIGGVGTWLALILKVAFALVGLGAYLGVFWPEAPYVWIAVALAVGFGLLNWLSARRTSGLQIVLVVALLAALTWFMGLGVTQVDPSHFRDFFGHGQHAVLSTAGMVCISYIGLTKVASVSEEVVNPERNLPLGVFLAVAVATLVYAVGTYVMVGVLPAAKLYGSLTPVSMTADALVGRWGAIVMSVAALLAFFSVANAGILSASRYPLAMSRDHLMPRLFRRLGRFRTPTTSIAATVALVIVAVLVLDPLKIAKLAAAFQLILFAFNCLAVIVMRESRIESYDPGYRAPLYPWLQILGIVAPLVLIAAMGWLPVGFSGGMMVIGFVWFMVYGKRRVARVGAIYHVFARLGKRRFEDLDRELRGILKEKGLRKADPFEDVVARSDVLDIEDEQDFETIAARASERLALRIDCPTKTLLQGFLDGTRTGATPVTGGIALPHLRLPKLDRPQMVIVRARHGVTIDTADLYGETHTSEPTFAIFFLVSPDADPRQHLRLLAELASRVDEEGFIAEWCTVTNGQRLQEVLLRQERYLSLVLEPGSSAERLIGRALREIELPEGSLVAVIRRGAETVIPGGRTELEAGDELTIIGHAPAIASLQERYGAPRADAETQPPAS
ncbi:MAG: amino acid permease [Planctomycetota bacterium]|jgi:amino acid transporter/mannitol/fructose-specific phosphotransferase system IIA component (Ntr-type)